MGYFSNGTEGESYYEQYCAKCVHTQNERACAVWFLHLMHNGQDAAKPFLDELIPRDGCWNCECKMFVETKRTRHDTPLFPEDD